MNKLEQRCLNGSNIRAIFQRQVYLSPDVGGHLGILFADDQHALFTFGLDEIARLENHVIARRSMNHVPSFQFIVLGEQKDAAQTQSFRPFDLIENRPGAMKSVRQSSTETPRERRKWMIAAAVAAAPLL